MKKILLPILASAFVFGANAQDCSDLFFSEYVEGTSQNKALEIYNPTSEAIDLSDYAIKRYKNGGGDPDTNLPLSGTIEPYGVVVITNAQTDETNTFGFVDPALYALGDIHGTGDHATSPMFFNGNDALTLEKISDESIVDIFGKVGEDPGDGWNNDETTNYIAEEFWQAWTKDHVMIRKPSVKKGVTVNPDYFNTGLEYDTLPENTWTNLGLHECECKEVSIGENATAQTYIYPNPVENGNFRVNSSKNLSYVELYNIVGQPVFRDERVEGKSSVLVNTSELVSGVYFIKLHFTDNKEQIHKIVIR